MNFYFKIEICQEKTEISINKEVVTQRRHKGPTGKSDALLP
jgi:hypothetical protein